MCKFGNKNVFLIKLWHFLWNFFDFPIFSIYRKWEFSFFPKMIFGLITHIIILFQTVQIQKARLLAHLSRRLTGELIVYPCSGVRPSVRRPSSASVGVHNFKDLLL